MIKTKEAAKTLLKQGIITIPIESSDTKRPAKGVMWRDFNNKNYDNAAIEKLYSKPHQSLAVLGGYVSNCLEILDVDLKNADDPDLLWQDLIYNLGEALPDFTKNSTIVKTPSGGYHIYYSCFDIEGNKHLAKNTKGKVIIETRGDGGYALTFPSENYEIIQGSLDSFAYPISPDDRKTLFDVCKIFNEELEDVEHKEVKKFIPRAKYFIRNPFEDYNNKVDAHEVEQLIFDAGFETPKQHGSKIFYKRVGSDNKQGGNYHISKRLFYPFTDNSKLDSGKAYTPATMLRLLRFNGDGKECYKWLIENGYGEKIKQSDEIVIEEAKKLIEDGKEDVKEQLLKKNSDSERLDVCIEIAKTRIQRLDVFWHTNDKDKIIIDIFLLKCFLENHGFRKYKYNSTDLNSILVHIDEKTKIIQEVDLEFIKKFLLTYITDEKLGLPVTLQNDIIKAAMENTTKFFKDSMLEWLDGVTEGKEVKILKDNKHYSYLFFKNHVVKISAVKPEIMTYDKLPKGFLIWKSTIIDKDISLINLAQGSTVQECEFYRFMKRLIGMGADTDATPIADLIAKHEDGKKLAAFITSWGYMCHNYRDRRRSWAIIVAEDILDSNKGGGTGKGVLLNSLTYVRKTVTEPGKQFDINGKNSLQKWTEGTSIYMIEDTPRKFDFEAMYNFITDGGHLEIKYKTASTIPFEKLPKLIFTTNYGDMADGKTHGERRRKLLLVGNYFGPQKTIFDEFGHILYDDWDDFQWNLFYNFIFNCISTYLACPSGVVDFPNSENVKIKTFKSSYGEEIYDYFDGLKYVDWPFPRLLSDLRKDFHEEYNRKNFSAQIFKIALDKFCRMHSIELEESLCTKRENFNKKMVRMNCGENVAANVEIEENDEKLPF